MRLASILADLSSLSVCDHDAALALVSARPSSTLTSATAALPDAAPTQPSSDNNLAPAISNKEADADLARAHTLLRLHHVAQTQYASSQTSQRGPTAADNRHLQAEREAVARAVSTLRQLHSRSSGARTRDTEAKAGHAADRPEPAADERDDEEQNSVDEEAEAWS